MRKCPFCQKAIEYTDVKCRYCGSVSWFDQTKKAALNNVIYCDKFSEPAERHEHPQAGVQDEKDTEIKKARIIATVVLAVFYVLVSVYSYLSFPSAERFPAQNLVLVIGALLVPSAAFILYMVYPQYAASRYGYYATVSLLIVISIVALLQIQFHHTNPLATRLAENQPSSKSAASPIPATTDSHPVADSEKQMTESSANPYDRVKSMNDEQFLNFARLNKNSKNPLPGIGYAIDKKSGRVIRLIQEPRQ